MSSKEKLERLFHRAVKFPDPTRRLASLREAFDATEAAISHQGEQYALRTKASLKKRGMHPDDIDLELYIMRTTTEELFPQVFRGGFLVSVWAVFESGVKDLAEYTRVQLGHPFGLQDLRASGFLEQAERFFKTTLNIAPFPAKQDRKQLELLKGFRNTIAHHNGSFDQLPKELRTAEPAPFQKFSDLHHTFAVPSAEYNRASIDVAENVCRELAESVYKRLHPHEPKDA